VANPVYSNITATGTYTFWLDNSQSPFNASYAVEFAASTTGSYLVTFTLDDPEDTTWTPIWNADPTNGSAQTATAVGSYQYPIRGLRIVFSALGGTTLARVAILQGNPP
jgi:hypothetical protein